LIRIVTLIALLRVCLLHRNSLCVLLLSLCLRLSMSLSLVLLLLHLLLLVLVVGLHHSLVLRTSLLGTLHLHLLLLLLEL
jgi:hypothetical protein